MDLKELRLQAGLNQAAVAEKLNVTQSAVSHWERGAEKPNRKYHSMMCQIFSCTIEQLKTAIQNSFVRRRVHEMVFSGTKCFYSKNKKS